MANHNQTHNRYIVPSFFGYVKARLAEKNRDNFLKIIFQEALFSVKKRNLEVLESIDLQNILNKRDKFGEYFDAEDQGIINKFFDKNKYGEDIVISRNPSTPAFDGYISNKIEFQLLIRNKIIFFANDSLCKINLDYLYGKSSPASDHICFENCILLCEGQDDFSPHTRQLRFVINKNEKNSVSFNNCFLRNISPYLEEKTRDIDYNHDNVRYLNANTGVFSFKNVIGIHSGFYAGASLDTAQLTDKSFSNTCIDMLLTRVIMENCSFKSVTMQSNFFTFKGKNHVQYFSNRESGQKRFIEEGNIVTPSEWNRKIKPVFSWGPYQDIIPGLSNTWSEYNNPWREHKDYLTKLRTLAEEKKDAAQVSILNREITKCDHGIINSEPGRYSWQDKFTFCFNKLVSNYGISWVRPIILLAFANAIFSAIIVLSYGQCFCFFDCFVDFFLVLSKTFDPLFNYSNMFAAESISASKGVLLMMNFLQVIQKIIFAACTYEVIRAGRRFTRMNP